MEFAKKIQINTYVINLQDLESATGRILLQILHLQTGGCNPLRFFNAVGNTETLTPTHYSLSSQIHITTTLLSSSTLLAR